MYCILVTGIPASGKSTMARFLAEAFGLPVISKDRIKEWMYDTIGFRSREEKVKLGIASMQIMYDLAEELRRKAPGLLSWKIILRMCQKRVCSPFWKNMNMRRLRSL